MDRTDRENAEKISGAFSRSSAPARFEPRLSLPVLLLEFLKIGALGFGGGMAIIALMERTFVGQRRAMDSEEFLHGVGLSQVLGPFAVNTSLFVGYRLCGPAGGLLSLLAFITPSVALVLLLSWLYFAYHSLPALQKTMAGLAPVVIALILAAAWSMARTAVRKWPAAILAALALALGLAKTTPVYALLAAGLAGLLLGRARLAPAPGDGLPACRRAGEAAGADGHAPDRYRSGRSPLPALFLAPAAVHLPQLALAFFKIGFMFLGGGFVVIPVLYQQLVIERGWLSMREFVDGLAISNLTPGPVSVLATFAGFRVGGVSGALAATLALYAPAVALMLLLCHSYGRAGQGGRARDFLAGIAPAVVGLVASAALLLGRESLVSWRAGLLAAAGFVLLALRRWPPLVVLGIGALLGALQIMP
jgi:chromate transporter